MPIKISRRRFHKHKHLDPKPRPQQLNHEPLRKQSERIGDKSKEKRTNKPRTLPFNPKTINWRELIYDNFLDEWIYPIWTDGSHNPSTNNSTSAIAFGANLKNSTAFECWNHGNALIGEINALEYALNNLATNVRSVIFVDCSSAITALQKPPEKYSDIHKDPNFSFQNRITSTLTHIHNANIPPPDVIKIYSHIADKLRDPNTTPEKKKRIEANKAYIADRYSSVTFEDIEKGNIKADELASNLSASKRSTNIDNNVPGLPPYSLIRNKEVLEGNANLHLRKEHQKIIHKERLSYSKKQHRNFEHFNLNLSNHHLKDDNPAQDKLIGQTLKLRKLAYFLPARCSPNKIGKQGKANINVEIMYPTPICELCKNNEECDRMHLHI